CRVRFAWGARLDTRPLPGARGQQSARGPRGASGPGSPGGSVALVRGLGLGVLASLRRSFQLAQRLGEAGNAVRPRRNLQAGPGEILADGLGAPAQALGQKALGDRIERNPVLRPGKAMT